MNLLKRALPYALGWLKDFMAGWGTYTAAAGSLGLAVYLWSQDKHDEAAIALVTGIGLLRARAAVERVGQ